MRLYYAGALPLPYLYLFHRREGVEKLARRMGIEDIGMLPGKTAQMWTFKPKKKYEACVAIVLYEPDDSLTVGQECSLMAHEAVHIVEDIYAEIGEDKPGTEETSYLVQAITQALIDGNEHWRSKHAEK